MSFFQELKRRNVIRVGIAYAVTSWLVVQISDVVIDNIGAPDWLFKGILLLLGIGFPLVMIFAWAFELTPEGIKKEKDVDRTQSITPLPGASWTMPSLRCWHWAWRISSGSRAFPAGKS